MPHLEERLGEDVGFFHGRLSARRRDEVLAAFAREDGPRVLVISIRAGGRGLNLPAANHVFHFDRWWNPAVEQQATDRVHRFGQRKHVYVHSLICAGTLEERIDELLESKRELADKVIAGRSEDWLGDLDLGAIRAAVALSPDLVEDAAWPWRALHDGRPIAVVPSAIGSRGPWARLLASAVIPRRELVGGRARAPARRSGAVHPVEEGRRALSQRRRGARGDDRRAAGPAACLGRDRALGPRRPPLQAAVEGRTQSVHLQHQMAVDWEEPLVPGGGRSARAAAGAPRAASTSPRRLRRRGRDRPRPVAAAPLARLRRQAEDDPAGPPEPAPRRIPGRRGRCPSPSRRDPCRSAPSSSGSARAGCGGARSSRKRPPAGVRRLREG